MIRPILSTVPQRVGNVLSASGVKTSIICIRKPGIFKLANVEMELGNHCLEARNAEMRVRLCKVDLVAVVTVIADKEIEN